MDVNKPSFLIVCEKNNFMLPVYRMALDRTSKSFKSTIERYVGALVLDIKGNVKIIDKINLDSDSVFDKLLITFGLRKMNVSCHLLSVEIPFSELLKKIAYIACNGDSYSVWGQFHNSKRELEKDILHCNSVADLFRVLRVEGEGETASELS